MKEKIVPFLLAFSHLQEQRQLVFLLLHRRRPHAPYLLLPLLRGRLHLRLLSPKTPIHRSNPNNTSTLTSKTTDPRVKTLVSRPLPRKQPFAQQMHRQLSPKTESASPDLKSSSNNAFKPEAEIRRKNKRHFTRISHSPLSPTSVLKQKP